MVLQFPSAPLDFKLYDSQSTHKIDSPRKKMTEIGRNIVYRHVAVVVSASGTRMTIVALCLNCHEEYCHSKNSYPR